MTESETTAATASSSGSYRVFARKYRPTTFDGLIGQDVLVRTLTNAFRTERLAHAYMLSGVRGVGKTTTARIVARALNCVGPDGTGGPTPSPCGVCEHCRAIAEDRHMDVIEMDAASRTGVDDIRDLIDGIPYRPVSARYKVYIIDEIHMLSKHAFNALLKTLEEPPEHVRFIFATTELRKVPVTVLSRCQRFDLRRVDIETLVRLFAAIVDKEGATVSEPALRLIARAADGSVRDGLSLLDQAIGHCEGAVDEDAVSGMLGLADRSVVFDLLEAALRGDAPAALALFDAQYAAGADPVLVLNDMLAVVHWLTRIKVVPECADAPEIPEAERVRGRAMAAALTMAALTRAWQMLLKGVGEARAAPSPKQATEMVIIRLVYAARLPTPAEALARLDVSSPAATVTSPPPGSPAIARSSTNAPPQRMSTGGDGSGPRAALARAPRPAAPEADAAPARPPAPTCFEDVVALAGDQREAILQGHLLNQARLVRFAPGHIELRLEPDGPAGLPRQLSAFLSRVLGTRWLVTVSQQEGGATLREQRDAADAERRARAAEHPLVRTILATFPGATIDAVRPLRPMRAAGTTGIETNDEEDDENADEDDIRDSLLER